MKVHGVAEASCLKVLEGEPPLHILNQAILRDKDKMFAKMLKRLNLVVQLHENRLCRHFPVHAEFLV